MTATYNPALASNLDWVRFHLGDTDATKAIRPDETITALLARPGATALSVAAQLARSIAAEYARKVDFDVDGEGAKNSQLREAFLVLADDLDGQVSQEKAASADEDATARAEAMGGGIMVGGLSVRDNVRRSEDEDRAANFSPLYDE